MSLRTEEKTLLWWSNKSYGPEFYDRTKTHKNPTIHETQLKEYSKDKKHEKQISKKFSNVALQHYKNSNDNNKEDLDKKTKNRLRNLGYLE